MPVENFGVIDHLRNELNTNRDSHLQKWKLISKDIAPNRLRDNPHDPNNGSRKDKHILKHKAGLALRVFQAGMLNGSTPQTRPWFNYGTIDDKLNNDTQSKRYFEQCKKIVNNYLQVGNFYRVGSGVYKDIGLFSNSAFAMLPHPDYGFWFYPFAVGSYAIASDADGNTTTFSRDFTLSVRQIVEKYGLLKENGHIDWNNSLNEYIKMLWDGGKYQERIVMSNVILPNKKPKENPFLSQDKRFQSYTYITGGGTNIPNQERMGFAQVEQRNARNGRSEFLSVRGYDYFPVITPRWEVQAEEDWGIDGPGEMALGYVRSLQEKERFRLEAIAKLVKPPMMGPANLRRHQASILAGGITYYDEDDRGSFKPVFEVDPKLNDLMVSQQEDERDIDACFFKDLFLMLAGDKPTSHVTATQIEQMAGERLSAITPVLGQLNNDFNGPVTENAHYILHSQGRLPEPPKGLKGQPLKVEYTSTLAQAAKASQMKTIERSVNFAASLAQVTEDPSLLRMIKSPQLLREYFDNAGLEPSLYLDEAEFAQVQQAIAQQQALRQQAEAQAQAAETARTMSQAKLGENSMLDNVASQSR